ncbi:hypothetical protein A6U86_21275 [Rhizobium sp. AC27/96]|uniref:hypothetical protein n=1 Tax=Rhizobium sp. AC27/96 TaxID=1841653 RepID=UPI00082793CB|nr:hypothetical protein [Rhizobium sp. AC27/96]OCI91188.1 hypothetical protein A6U86_21275 [Rhizobium sp. AC27/96]
MDYETLFKLIERQGTLEQVSNFLRQRSLPFSGGSWRDMIDLRLRPSVEKGALDENDLVDLLRQTEEYGAQHIFLFQLVDGRNLSSLFDGELPQRLKAACFPSLGSTSIIDMPKVPSVVEVREEFDGIRSFTFKIVEKRAFFEKLSDETGNGQLVVTYAEVPYRAVNLMRISEDGRAEIRLQSHKDAISYGGLAEAVFNTLKPIIDRLDWKDQKLDRFKSNLLDDKKRNELMKIFGLRQTLHSNKDGTRLTAAAGAPGASMYDDTDVVASVDRFLQKDNHAHCERASVTVKRSEALSRSVGLIVSGEANEFAITAKVSKTEYDYILGSVLENNK